MTRAVGRSGASVAGRIGSALVALGIGGVLAAPGAATAAPAPCERADRYAAETGAQVFRVNQLDGSAGTADGVALGEAKSALIAQSTVNAAAVTRILDADRRSGLTEPLIQQAPPNRPTPAQRTFTQRDAGPFTLGRGTLTSSARWDPRMACGRAAGQVTRAEAAVTRTAIGDLLRAPGLSSGSGTTALVRGGRTVASTELTLGGLELAGGAVRVRVVRQPTLVASMSTSAGGTVAYRPPVLEVSGDGVQTSRLDTPGDQVDIALGGTDQGDDTDRRAEAGAPADAVGTDQTGSTTTPRQGIPRLGVLGGGMPLPLPAVPGLPRVGDQPESAPAAGPGTHVRISLGDVRRATSGHAIAARATAITIVITRGRSDSRTKPGYGGRNGVVLDLDLGVLDAAAVAPERGTGFEGVVAGAGAGGGLPVTGPRVDVVVLTGFALLGGGMVALVLGLRRRA